MKPTSPFKKLTVSAINVCLIGAVSLPVILLMGLDFSRGRWVFLGTAFLYLLASLANRERRSPGMILAGVHWQERYSLARISLYGILYLISMATLFFWIWFPFDLFLINILCLQYPCVRLTGTTLHGYLSGRLTTIQM